MRTSDQAFSFGLALFLMIVFAGLASGAQTQDTVSICKQPLRSTGAGPIRVALWPYIPNNIRDTPNLSALIIGSIPPGEIAAIPSGEGTFECADGIYWVYINYENIKGWTAEGNGDDQYWLEPVPNSGTKPSAYCLLPGRLVVGMQGRVSPGLPNVIRSAPITTGKISTILGNIPAGDLFDVVGMSECGTDGRLWWPVSYNGLTGWTAEGEKDIYWLEPIWTTHDASQPHMTLHDAVYEDGFYIMAADSAVVIEITNLASTVSRVELYFEQDGILKLIGFDELPEDRVIMMYEVEGLEVGNFFAVTYAEHGSEINRSISLPVRASTAGEGPGS